MPDFHAWEPHWKEKTDSCKRAVAHINHPHPQFTVKTIIAFFKKNETVSHCVVLPHPEHTM